LAYVAGKYDSYLKTNKPVISLLLLLLSSSSSSNFSLFSFDWETFTYPGMQQSTGLGWVALFVVLKVPYN